MSRVAGAMMSTGSMMFNYRLAPRIAVWLLGLVLLGSGADQGQSQPAAAPLNFVAIHFEPRSADARGFASLQALLALADGCRTKLTLQFTPSWAEFILADPKRLRLLRDAQAKGHEVAVHHHGAQHEWESDGYSNLPEAEYERKRETVRRRSGPEVRHVQDLARQAGLGETYRGDMKDLVALLGRLAGDRPLRLATMGPDHETDWPAELPYGIDNAVVRPDGTYAISGAANTALRRVRYSGHEVLELGMRFIDSQRAVEAARQDHAAARPGEAVGVVTHIEDFAGDAGVLQAWMSFLRKKDPEGRRTATASEVLEALQARPR